jgi:hypothetical protein
LERDGEMGVHLDGSRGVGVSRLEVIEGPSGRRRRTKAERACVRFPPVVSDAAPSKAMTVIGKKSLGLDLLCIWDDSQLGTDHGALPPRHGSSSASNVCGGAQRGISLATGTFTGESRRNPPAARFWKKRLIIKDLRNHDLGVVDSFRNPGNPVCGSQRDGSQPAEATP